MDYSGNYNIRSNSISLYKGSNLLMDSSSLDTVVIQPTFTPISSLSSPNVLNDLLAKNISLQSSFWTESMCVTEASTACRSKTRSGCSTCVRTIKD